jgi:hypothetical protein
MEIAEIEKEELGSCFAAWEQLTTDGHGFYRKQS